MNSNITYSKERFKPCAGKFCKNFAKVSLKVQYINKVGFFCQSCADDLVREGLATIEGEEIGKTL